MGYTNYWTQNKIDNIPKELINDIIKLFKYIYKDNFKHIYLVNKDDSDNSDNKYYISSEECYIHKLDSSKIERETPCEWFIVDVKKSGFAFCKTYGRWYDYIVKCLIMLSVHYNVIQNNWSDDGYDEDTINECKKVLYNIGYTTFNCKYNDEEGHYYLDMKKDKEDEIKFHTIDEYFVKI